MDGWLARQPDNGFWLVTVSATTGAREDFLQLFGRKGGRTRWYRTARTVSVRALRCWAQNRRVNASIDVCLPHPGM